MTAAKEAFPAWAHSVTDVIDHHDVDIKHGLTSAQVEERRAQYGYNEFEEEPPTPLWKLILVQFDDTLVKVLLMAAGISFALAWFEENDGDAAARVRAFIEPAVILLILALNAAVGVWQENNAESALEALKQMSADTAKVFRDGRLVSALPCRELVPGDVVELHTGDRVPADVRLTSLHSAMLRVEQAALTGESASVSKSAAAVCGKPGPASGRDSPPLELHAKENMLFAGTGVASGSATGIVNSIGMATEMGAIQEQIKAAAAEESDTPLKRMLDEFGENLARVILGVCIAVWVINYRHFCSWDHLPGSTWVPDPSTFRFSLARATFYFKVAVALAVAAIPEGLPAVITTCLALGTRKMAQRNAIVRHLPSVETLGCTTVICSDKTGTLTTNQMAAVALVSLDGSGGVVSRAVDGTTYDPDDGGVPGLSALPDNLARFAEVCALCTGARVEVREGQHAAVGQPTEAALLVLAEKLGRLDASIEPVGSGSSSSSSSSGQPLSPRAPGVGAAALPAAAAYAHRFQKVDTLEFDRERKSMSVIAAPNTGAAAASGRTRRASRAAAAAANVLLVKGAGECVLARCSHAALADGSVVALSASTRAALTEAMDAMASRALRVLAAAVRRELPGALAGYDGREGHPGHAALQDPTGYAGIESGLVFLGAAGLQDPPRREVAGAIAGCHAAGIRVIVITGDNRLTAEAVCAEIGVFAGGEPEPHAARGGGGGRYADRSFTGAEFAALSPADADALLAGGRGVCISRAEPGHKQDIVRRLRAVGEVVAMTGDGVNDAPALKLADIGVAMGIAGTEVAKEAADMILADDNFATVVAAVEEGRAIYANMKAFIRYMISSNIGEVACIFLAAALGLPEGLLPVQLLWVNLVTDGPPATALGFNPPDADVMTRPPRRTGDHFITPWLLFRWVVVGAYVGVATVGIFVVWYTRTSFLGVDLSGDGHVPVSFAALRDWEACPGWAADAQPGPGSYAAGGELVAWTGACEVFSLGKVKASTLSLSVLVAIEMFNAANALSEDTSLLRMPVWRNPWLLAAMALSFSLHALILYVPALAATFSIVPLSLQEWALVLLFSLPVIAIDEVLKFIGRHWVTTHAAFPEPADAKDKDA